MSTYPTETQSLAITVDGVVYTLRPSELTGEDAQALRKATGQSIRGVMTTAKDDPDLDTLAALIWLARRAAGEHVDFGEVMRSITYSTPITVGEAPAEVADPET